MCFIRIQNFNQKKGKKTRDGLDTFEDFGPAILLTVPRCQAPSPGPAGLDPDFPSRLPCRTDTLLPHPGSDHPPYPPRGLPRPSPGRLSRGRPPRCPQAALRPCGPPVPELRAPQHCRSHQGFGAESLRMKGKSWEGGSLRL